MSKCLIALGSNLGNRRYNLDEAVKQLRSYENIRFLARSRPIVTNPIGGPSGQGSFVNEVLVIDTNRTPESLLQCAQQIENSLGRVRSQRWGARTIDIDLLMFDQRIIHTPFLQIPHPRMMYRRFVLQPASEIAPEFEHPVIGWSLARLLENLNSPTNYLAFTGADILRTKQIARVLANRLDLQLMSDSQSATLHQAGQTLATWLEFLDHRHELIARQCGKTNKRFTVGDFWINEVLAGCNVDLPATELRIIEQRWRKIKPEIIQPKLLIYLTTPKPLQHEAKKISSAVAARRLTPTARFIAELDKVIAKPAPCPVVRLFADDPQNLEELIAAIKCLDSDTPPQN